MEKINLIELLKDCPKGMELDCALFEDIEFNSICDSAIVFPISCRMRLSNGDYKDYNFTKYGCFNSSEKAKCVIFPKGKTTWEGFVPPCQFKDGDIIFTHANCLQVGLGNTWISIFQGNRNGGVATYVDYAEDGDDYYDYIDGSKGLLCMTKDILRQRFATEEEKQKLFDAIKANGYKWNAETKTLEKLITRNKFQIGAKITNGKIIGKIRSRDVDSYQLEDGTYVFFNEVHKWELAPNKFDISTLKPFDKVLARDSDEEYWVINFFGFYNKKAEKFHCVGDYGLYWNNCIPYEGNEHLLGTTDDCDEYYKTWE